VDKTITIIIPCYNEEKGLRSTVNEVINAFSIFSYQYEIIIVDDCSYDNTRKIAKELSKSFENVRTIENSTNQGFCKSYMNAVWSAKMNYCLYVPGDNDLKSSELCKILAALGKSDVIITSFSNINSRVFYRRLLSLGYTKLINLISGNNFKYYNGFNIYKVKELKKINLITHGFSFQANLLLEMVNLNQSVYEVEVSCGFNDSKSSALRLKNISQVILFIYKLFLKSRCGLAV
jgi:glycosyltransferase involved in cell wall biosynthesis